MDRKEAKERFVDLLDNSTKEELQVYVCDFALEAKNEQNKIKELIKWLEKEINQYVDKPNKMYSENWARNKTLKEVLDFVRKF